ncbi:MAG: MBL fold metallo-hydrolase [Methylococcales bacterium]
MHEDLGFGITCIDTEYCREKMAACYLIQNNNRAAIVDTGTNFSIPNILEVLKIKNISISDVEYVIPTHVHLDHAGGVGKLMRLCPEARLVIHPRGASHMIDPTKLIAGSIAVYGEKAFYKNYGELEPVSEDRVILAEEMALDLAGRTLLFLDAPGHARHHLCIVDEYSKGIFSGDVFGVSYREFDSGKTPFVFPPSTPVQFDPDAWHNTLDRLMTYSPERMYLTHYSMVTDIKEMCSRLHFLIDEYVKIAKEHINSSHRYQKIHKKMSELLLSEIAACGCGLSEQKILNILSIDLDLNTQGLEVWLDRRQHLN